MTNLGSGGEAKAAMADRDDAETMHADVDDDRPVDQTERGGTMDEAMAANMDPDLVDDNEPMLGAGETAAYGETIENAPAPTDARQ